MPFASRLSIRSTLGARVAGAAAAFLVLVAVATPAYAVEGPTGLLDPSVSPSTGTPTTLISIEVTYRNHEGSEAAFVDVVIDGQAHAMAGAGSDWKNGVLFSYATTLSTGSHGVSFKAADTRKFESFLDGPTIVIGVPTPTPTPPPTPTPTPRPTPTPTAQPTATPTPRPTATPARTPTAPGATPTPTPAATSTANASPTASPSGTGAPTAPSGTTGSGASPTPGASTTGVLLWPPGSGPNPPATDDYPPPGGPPAGGSGGWQGGYPGAYGGGAGSLEDRGDPWSSPSGPAGGDAAGDAAAAQGGHAGGDPNAQGSGTAGSGDAASSAGASGGAGAEALRSLGFGTPPLPLAARLTVEAVATGGGVALAMAFLMFGKRRRDGEQPAPDDVLHAAASTPVAVATASLVPAFAPAPAPYLPGGLSPEEMAMPRWRRPSLMAARKADPLRDSIDHSAMTFDHGAVGPVEGYERRLLRYRLVRLLDQPDELRGTEIGFLDQGDEVQLIQRSGAYWLVLCPDGSRGWIHKMTLGDVVEAEPPGPGTGRRPAAGSASSAGPRTGAGLDSPPPGAFVAGAAFAAAGAAVAGGDDGRASTAASATDGSPGSADAATEDLAGLDDDVVIAFLSARRAG